MSAESEAFLRKMKSAHVILVINGDFYLIPFESLEREFKMPAAFQRHAAGIDPNYFVPNRADVPADTEIDVHKGFSAALNRVFALDGVDQAVRILDAEGEPPIKFSRTAESGKVLFKYNSEDRIVVETTRGGRPSSV